MTPAEADGRSPVAALVLGWILPGAGHAYAGRWGKGVLFFLCITGLVVAGLVLADGTNVLPERLWYAAQVCAGGPAVALTPVSQYIARQGPIDWADPLHEMGTLYTAVAGFLNLLVMMDAYTRLAYPHAHRDAADDEEDA
jgi:TM2 domain-containing membrane protein YozV